MYIEYSYTRSSQLPLSLEILYTHESSWVSANKMKIVKCMDWNSSAINFFYIIIS
jgi:hypothetical protein